MSTLLTDPGTVLVVGAAPHDLEAALAAGPAAAVETVPDAAAVEATLVDREDVGCVVATDGSDPVTIAERVQDHDSLLPVVAYVSEGSESLAAAFTTAGGTTYCTPDTSPEDLADLIDRALMAYDDRRRDREDAEILDVLFEEMSTAMYAKDTKGRHVRAARVPGAPSPEELLGKTDMEVYGDDDANGAKEGYEDDLRVIQEETSVTDRLEHHEHDGQDHYLRTSKVPWYDDEGEVKGLVGLSWDVSDYMQKVKRLERQEERIDEFASYVSHDLRGPVQVATGAVDLAKEADELAAAHDELDRVEDALARIEDMIDDLSSVVKEGRASTSFSMTDLESPQVGERTPIADLARDVWSVIDAPDSVELGVEFGDDAVVHASENSLRPILENLFQNAVVHAGPDVTITVGPLDAGGFFVEDNGPGIPPERRDRVADRGYTTSDDEDGGTGLHIVAEIVGSHEWDLEICESADGGARFEVGNCLAVPTPDARLASGTERELTNSVDVGDVGTPGNATYDDLMDTWTVSGAGSNIWRHENQFHFVYAPIEGDGRIQGRVVEMDQLSEYSKAGMMIRGDLDEDAPYGYVGVTPEHGTEVLWRTERGGAGVSQQLEDDPGTIAWYRVDRVGETVTTFVSTDGDAWHPVDQRTVAIGDLAYVGLVVCSFTPRRLCKAEFADIEVLAGDRG